MPKRYRKRPVIIEAIQWTGDNEAEIQQWAGANNFYALDPEDSENPEDTAAVRVAANGNTELCVVTGEWILRDKSGFYPCNAERFAETYEAVDNA